MSNEKLRDKFEIELRKHSIPTIRVELPKDQFGEYKFSQDQEKWKFYQLGANAINTPKHENVEELLERFENLEEIKPYLDSNEIMQGYIQFAWRMFVLGSDGKPEIEE